MEVKLTEHSNKNHIADFVEKDSGEEDMRSTKNGLVSLKHFRNRPAGRKQKGRKHSGRQNKTTKKGS